MTNLLSIQDLISKPISWGFFVCVLFCMKNQWSESLWITSAPVIGFYSRDVHRCIPFYHLTSHAHYLPAWCTWEEALCTYQCIEHLHGNREGSRTNEDLSLHEDALCVYVHTCTGLLLTHTESVSVCGCQVHQWLWAGLAHSWTPLVRCGFNSYIPIWPLGHALRSWQYPDSFPHWCSVPIEHWACLVHFVGSISFSQIPSMKATQCMHNV